LRSQSGSGSIVPIHVKRAGVDDPLATELFRTKSDSIVAAPEDGALTGTIHKNKGLLAGASRSGEEMRLDAGSQKFRRMDGGCGIVANFADVSSTKSPVLASHHGAGDLSTGENVCGTEFHLRAALGEVRERNQRVRGVEPNADGVNLG
jgi:hypothetical protein